MKHHFVHYDPATGRIVQASSSPFVLEGYAAAEVNAWPDVIDAHEQRVDLASVQDAPHESGWKLCRLVQWGPGEGPPRPPWVTLEGMRDTRTAMLRATDEFMIPDRPMSQVERDAWADYRQQLRALGELETIQAFVAAWPLRPDGNDDIATIREKVSEV